MAPLIHNSHYGKKNAINALKLVQYSVNSTEYCHDPTEISAGMKCPTMKNAITAMNSVGNRCQIKKVMKIAITAMIQFVFINEK